MTTEDRNDALTYKYYATINSVIDEWGEIQKYVVLLHESEISAPCVCFIYKMKGEEWHNKKVYFV